MQNTRTFMQTDLQHGDRRATILRLLRGSAVRRQGELVDLLKREGFEVTQSSVSRDLRDLGVLKAAGRYLPPEAGARALDDFGALRPFVRGVATAGAPLTVLRTTTGVRSCTLGAQFQLHPDHKPRATSGHYMSPLKGYPMENPS